MNPHSSSVLVTAASASPNYAGATPGVGPGSNPGDGRTYRKPYKDPHTALKIALAALLASALSLKLKLILLYIADNGQDGLLDYAENVLDTGWDKYFAGATALLSHAATTSAMEILDDSDAHVSDEFIANLEKHNDIIAKAQAASLLGLSYDPMRKLASPTLIGWTPGVPLTSALEKTLAKAEEGKWTSTQLETAITDLTAFSPERAQSLAHNALAFVDGAVARGTASMTGATDKRSETMKDDRVCAECIQNAEDGWIAVNARFSGSNTEDTPHHKNCRCSVEYRWITKPQEVALPA